jgi:hypothetical protein
MVAHEAAQARLEVTGIEFIDENGESLGVRPRKRLRKNRESEWSLDVRSPIRARPRGKKRVLLDLIQKTFAIRYAQ